MLPRVVDILKGAQDMWRHRGEAADNADFQVELVRCVWDDPYNQLGAATAEQEHCLALHPNGESIILFKTVLYGFEATPLILGRLSATVGRMWQAFLDDHQGAVQAHMEEQLVMIQGPKKTRDTLVALLVYTVRVLGLNLSYERGSRGSRTKLMGMNLAVDLKAKEVVIDFPKEMIMQLVEYLEMVEGKNSSKRAQIGRGQVERFGRSHPQDQMDGNQLFQGDGKCRRGDEHREGAGAF
jgi:hypothetical protein